MTNRYSLADYTVTITVPSDVAGIGGKTITIGGPGENGEGSFVGEIKITRVTDLWKATGDPTGSWVHSKNLDRTGQVSININQVSDNVIKLIQLCTIFETVQATKGLTITVSPALDDINTIYAECIDCYIKKIPDQVFGGDAVPQTWEFVVGQVTFPVSSAW